LKEEYKAFKQLQPVWSAAQTQIQKNYRGEIRLPPPQADCVSSLSSPPASPCGLAWRAGGKAEAKNRINPVHPVK